MVFNVSFKPVESPLNIAHVARWAISLANIHHMSTFTPTKKIPRVYRPNYPALLLNYLSYTLSSVEEYILREI